MRTVILSLVLLSSVTFAAERVLVEGQVTEQPSALLAGVDYCVTYDEAAGKVRLKIKGVSTADRCTIIYQAIGVLDDAGKAVNGYIGYCGHQPGPDDQLLAAVDGAADWYQFEIKAGDYSGNFGLFFGVVIRRDQGPCFETWFGVTNMTVPNDWANYDWSWENRIKFSTGPVVTAIMVRPKGFPADATLPDPLNIAAGAIESDAHQADVEIQVTPAEAGMSVSVSLVNGKGYTTAKDAKLVTDAGTATGGGEAKTMVTGAGGKITGTLTSSDVLTTCTIRAGSLERTVAFTWDEYAEEGEWTTDTDLFPIPGVLTNTLVLRHHRDPQTGPEPWKPLNGHRIRFFVEEAWYLEDGELKTDYDTVEQPGDLSGWASFLDMDNDESNTTNEAGRVTAYLQIEDRQNLVYLWVAAYDWTIWNEPASVATATAMLPPGPMRADGGAGSAKSSHPTRPTKEGEIPLAGGFVQTWTHIPQVRRETDGKALTPPKFKVFINRPVDFFKGAQIQWSVQKTGGDTPGNPPAAVMGQGTTESAAAWAPDVKGNRLWQTGTLFVSALEADQTGQYQVSFAATKDGVALASYTAPVVIVLGARIVGLDDKAGTFFDTQSLTKDKPTRYGILTATTAKDGAAAKDTWKLDAVGGGVGKDGFRFCPRGGKTAPTIPFDALLSKELTPDGTQLKVAVIAKGAGDQRELAEGEEAMTNATCYVDGTVQLRVFSVEATAGGPRYSWAVGGFSSLMRAETLKNTIEFPAGAEARKDRKDMPGKIEPFWFILADVAIASPNGDPTKPADAQRPKAGANATNELVFDDATPGGCNFTIKANPLTKLANSNGEGAAKELVIARLVWTQPPDLDVKAMPKCEAKWKPTVSTDPAGRQTDKLKKTISLDVVYETMPKTHEGFGPQTIQLNFAGRENWRWQQDVEFFFHAAGNGKRALVTLPDGTAVREPNWFYYWSQLPAVKTLLKRKANRNQVGDKFAFYTTGRPTWILLGTTKSYITCGSIAHLPQFITFLGHETRHETDFWNVVWAGKAYSRESDTDNDKLRDAWEMTMGGLDRVTNSTPPTWGDWAETCACTGPWDVTAHERYTGDVTEIAVDGLAKEIPPAGHIRLTNGNGQTERIAYSAYAEDTFTVSAKLNFVYRAGDKVTIENVRQIYYAWSDLNADISGIADINANININKADWSDVKFEVGGFLFLVDEDAEPDPDPQNPTHRMHGQASAPITTGNHKDYHKN